MIIVVRISLQCLVTLSMNGLLGGIWQSFSVVKSVENDLVPAHTHAHIHTLPFDLEKGLYSGASQKSLRLK